MTQGGKVVWGKCQLKAIPFFLWELEGILYGCHMTFGGKVIAIISRPLKAPMHQIVEL